MNFIQKTIARMFGLEAVIDSMSNTISEASATIRDLSSKAESDKLKIEDFSRRALSAEKECREMGKRISELNDTVDQLQVQLDSTKKMYDEKSTESEYVKSVLESMEKSFAKEHDDYISALKRIKNTEEDLADEKNKSAELENTIEELKHQLEQSRVERYSCRYRLLELQAILDERDEAIRNIGKSSDAVDDKEEKSEESITPEPVHEEVAPVKHERPRPSARRKRRKPSPED